MQSNTVILDRPLDVVALGARSHLLWRSTQITLAGLGRSQRVESVAAAAVLATVTSTPDLPPGVGPVAFGALPFTLDQELTAAGSNDGSDQDATGAMLIPEVVVATDGSTTWLTVLGEITPDAALAQIDELLAQPMPAGAEPTEISVSSALAPEVWRDEIVAEGIRRINAGEVQKVVLARELVVTSDRPIDPALVVTRLASTFPAAMVFNIDGFIGASPELLVSRSDNVVMARPLAGTAPRGASAADDTRIGDELLASAKNRAEHQITIDWFLRELLPFCSYVDAEPEPSLLTIANLHHLQTLVEGRLSSPPASILELVKAVHPTPAVGGDPQGDALALIAKIERADRGRYAGPAGWVDARGNGEFAVSVRSAQMDGNKTRLFVGVGVVADSEPQAELDETRVKARAILGALLQP